MRTPISFSDKRSAGSREETPACRVRRSLDRLPRRRAPRRPSAPSIPAGVGLARGNRPWGVCGSVLLVVPAALVQEPLGVELTDVGSALAAELDPGQLVLWCDEGQRASRDAHAGR